MMKSDDLVREASMPLVWLVDDDPQWCSLIKSFLKARRLGVEVFPGGRQFLEALKTAQPDIVLLDLDLGDMGGVEVLRGIRQEHDELQVVMLTGMKDVETAVQCIELGALDYLVKPVPLPDLEGVIRQAVRSSRLTRDARYLQKMLEVSSGLDGILGGSAHILELKDKIRRISPHEVSVLITGETGTGKERVAEALHKLSPRAQGPIVALDCGSLPETLVESELFGFEKGAFSGAAAQKRGRIEWAHQGVLFLDEVGNLSLGTQAKLLRVLQERKIRRIGGSQDLPADVRILAATNLDLDEAVKKGRFRADLLYRLKEFHLHLRPLREREGDIEVLAKAFLGHFSALYGKPSSGFKKEALDLLAGHPWPGNVRELRNVIRRALILADDLVGREHLPPELAGAAAAPGEAGGGFGPLSEVLSHALRRMESRLIRECLDRFRWNRQKAAESLGIDAKTLFNKIKEYGLA